MENNFKISDIEVSQNNVKSAQDALRGTPRENKNVFDKLPELIVKRHNQFVEYIPNNFYNKEETEKIVNNRVVDIGSSDMVKAVYDKNNNGIVDDCERLGGQLPQYYAKENNSWSLSGGIAIDKETDLNNITNIGNYYSDSNSNSQSLKNSPTKDAFTMKVIDGIGKSGITYKYIIQIVINHRTTEEWRRYATKSQSGNWTFDNWIKVVNAAEFNPIRTLAQGAMSKNGGRFTGSVNAMLSPREINYHNGELMNISVYSSDDRAVTTAKISMIRK